MSDIDNLDLSDLKKFRFVGAVEEDDTAAKKPADNLAEQLQSLLADVSTFYHVVHEAHWNIVGADFYQYHKFYDEIVSDVYDSIDPIAENIRKLGGKPAYRMSDLFKQATLKDNDTNSTDTASLTSNLIKLNQQLIDILKATFDTANKDNEQGVANFIAERIDAHQKWQWFLESSAGK